MSSVIGGNVVQQVRVKGKGKGKWFVRMLLRLAKTLLPQNDQPISQESIDELVNAKKAEAISLIKKIVNKSNNRLEANMFADDISPSGEPCQRRIIPSAQMIEDTVKTIFKNREDAIDACLTKGDLNNMLALVDADCAVFENTVRQQLAEFTEYVRYINTSVQFLGQVHLWRKDMQVWNELAGVSDTNAMNCLIALLDSIIADWDCFHRDKNVAYLKTFRGCIDERRTIIKNLMSMMVPSKHDGTSCDLESLIQGFLFFQKQMPLQQQEHPLL